MSFVGVLVAIVLIGVIAYVVNNIIPMDATFKKIFNVVLVVAVILWLLSVFGLLPEVTRLHIGR